MASLSSAAWAVHDVGLATAIGGTLFGRAALEPALHEIKSADERDRVSAGAWQRFSWLNLGGHAVMAATWLIGRTMLSGREVSGTARTLTKVKDGLVVASLLTGVTSIFLGRRLALRSRRGIGPAHARESNGDREARRTRAIERAVGGLGIANLITNVGIAAITAILGMEANKSVRFAPRSRWLP
jgi:hypothetical protein